MEISVILGMIAEVAMKARLLRERLKKCPESVSEVSVRLDVLEQEMFLCMIEFEDAMDT